MTPAGSLASRGPDWASGGNGGHWDAQNKPRRRSAARLCKIAHSRAPMDRSSGFLGLGRCRERCTWQPAAIAAGVLAGALVADISQVEEHRLTPLGACRLVNIVHPPDSTVGPNTAHYHGQNAWNSRMARTRISV
jgi:hypothetical protein